jgi:PmbA protein
MRDAIEQARGAVEQAELHWKRERTLSVSYGNRELQEIVDDDLSSVALRVIDGGRMGATCGVRPDEPALLDRAKCAAAYGDAAAFSFAPSAATPHVDNYDPAVADLKAEELISVCDSVRDGVLRLRPDVALAIGATATTTRRAIRTTEGVDAASESTGFQLWFGAPIRGAGIGVWKGVAASGLPETPRGLIEEFDEWYGWTETASTPHTGRLPVILTPEASFLYLLPLWAGLTGGAIEKKTSPLVDRMGDSILSPKLTLWDDALRAGDPAARPFDDEGTPCRRRAIVESGVLRGLFLDRRTGAALGLPSTGNGLKRELFASGAEVQANPWAIAWGVEPGDSSLAAMVSSLDEGLLVTGGLGFHSGNYPQGAFSVQAIGFHIRSGRVIGRLDRTMLSGNIYEDLLHVTSLSREMRATEGMLLGSVHAPYVLVESLQVAGQ